VCACGAWRVAQPAARAPPPAQPAIAAGQGHQHPPAAGADLEACSAYLATHMTTLLRPGDKVLFQGDSITDAGRSRENDTDMGRVRQAAPPATPGQLFITAD
jgi:hypothetical protein